MPTVIVVVAEAVTAESGSEASPMANVPGCRSMRDCSLRPSCVSCADGCSWIVPPLMFWMRLVTFEVRPVKKSKTWSVAKLRPVFGSTVYAVARRRRLNEVSLFAAR